MKIIEILFFSPTTLLCEAEFSSDLYQSNYCNRLDTETGMRSQPSSKTDIKENGKNVKQSHCLKKKVGIFREKVINVNMH